jgi:hypothetical protein
MQPPLTLPQLKSPRYFWRYWPGTEHLTLPPHPGLLSDQPMIFRLGYDVGRRDVQKACARAMVLLRAGLEARVLLPFYASRFVPAHYQRYLADGPGPMKLPDCLALIGQKQAPGYLAELNKACRDARGNYYPALWLQAAELIEQGEALLPALCSAYTAWAPDILAGLAELATDHATMLSGMQLVRDWHRHGRLAKKNDYFRTGREMLMFMEGFAAIKREGSGRLRWGPLHANVFSYLTTSGRL